jgi:hypothetical protein
MPTLDELIKQATERGLTHLTMWPVPSTDGKKIYWYARATPSTQHSYVQAHSEDPLHALKVVLESLPKAPKRAKSDKVTFAIADEEPKQLEVTATVKLDENIGSVPGRTGKEQTLDELDPVTPPTRKKGGLKPEWGV